MNRIKTFNDGTEKMLWEKDGRYIVTSYVNRPSADIHETMAFAADSSGRITDWLDLACCRGERAHEKCARYAFTGVDYDDCDDYSI